MTQVRVVNSLEAILMYVLIHFGKHQNHQTTSYVIVIANCHDYFIVITNTTLIIITNYVNR